jgi:hypothetical protein
MKFIFFQPISTLKIPTFLPFLRELRELDEAYWQSGVGR